MSQFIQPNEDNCTIGFKLTGQGVLRILLNEEKKEFAVMTFRATTKEEFLDIMLKISNDIYKNELT